MRASAIIAFDLLNDEADTARRQRALNDVAAAQPVVQTVPQPPNWPVQPTRRQFVYVDANDAVRCRCRSAADAAPLWVTFSFMFPLLLSYLLLVTLP